MVFGNALRRSCRNENARLPLANGRTELQRRYLKYRIAERSTPVMAAVRERCLAYLTYPAQAGITVTHSRGISPHSAVGVASDRTIPIFFCYYITMRNYFQANLRIFAKIHCRTIIHLGQTKKGMRNRASCVKVELPNNNLTKGDNIPHESKYNTGHEVSSIPNEVRREIWL